MIFAPKRLVPPSFTEPSRYTHARRIWKTSIGHVNNTIKQTHNHLSYTKRSLRGVTHPSMAREVAARAAAARMAARDGGDDGSDGEAGGCEMRQRAMGDWWLLMGDG